MDTGRSIAGFSLLEIMVTMGIATLGVSIGLPALQSLVERQRSMAMLNALHTHFASARVAAISRNLPTSVCPATRDGQCRTDSNWSGGWLSFHSPGNASQPATAEAIVRHDTTALHGSLRLVSSDGRRRIRFLPDGRSAGSNLTVTLCKDERAMGQVVVNNSGRIRSGTHGADDARCRLRG